MSWQAGSMLVLALGLIGGAVWYERSRPRPQVIAVVAAMAALAAAGRVLFSPIPNVAPTTDLTLFTGYALGGAPGFMVGALSALISNLWLGQGPWTPWQMAGWGLAGVVGASLAAVTGRRLGRVGLAIACGLMGLVYGVLLDYSAMVTFGGEQSLERYLALSARGLPFNLAHAAGNFALALVAGPAIVGLLERHRRRFTHQWARAGSTGLACLVIALSIAAGLSSGDSGQPTVASAATPTDHRGGLDRSSGFAWLRRAQNADGGFGSAPGRRSDPATTGWVALALAAAGRNPVQIRSRRGDGPGPVTYLRTKTREITSIGDLERTVLVLAACGLETDRFGGIDIRRRLVSKVARDGSLSGQVNLTAFYLLASKAAGHRVPRRSLAWLKGSQGRSGGWGYVRGASPDADSTGAALQALAAAGSKATSATTAGVRWLDRTQLPSGGWGLAGSTANSQSTAWALQGLIASGRNPASIRRQGRTGLDFLAARQTGGGSFRYSVSSNQTPVWVSAQALTAVAGKAFPIAAVSSESQAVSERTQSGSFTPQVGSAGPQNRGSQVPAPKSGADTQGAAENGSGSVGAGIGEPEQGGQVPDAGDSSNPVAALGGWLGEWWWAIVIGVALTAACAWFALRLRAILRS